MADTIFITGATSGIGKATAEYFAAQGWNVVATGRKQEALTELAQLENVLATRCDVTDKESIEQAMQVGVTEFGGIDVVLNNAGYGAVGAFEAATREAVDRQFNVNVFGLMEVMWAAIPRMREQGGGTIINISSIGGRMTFPLYSVYHSTKWAVEGLSESMQYELDQFNIRMKIVEPGAIKTDFYGRSMDIMTTEGLSAYNTFIKRAMPNMQHAGATGAPPEDVAKVIFKAATDGSRKMRYPAAGGARGILWLRRLLPERLFYWAVRSVILRKRQDAGDAKQGE